MTRHRRWRMLEVVLLVAAVNAAGLEMATRERINPGLGAPPPELVRSTPAATWGSFLGFGKAGRFGAAAHCLDLTEVPEGEQREVGPEVARKLYRVLMLLGAKPGQVTVNDEEGPKVGGEPTNVVVAFRFSKRGVEGEVWLRRTQDLETGETAWLFTRRTVSEAPLWYQRLVEGKEEEAAPLNRGLGPAPPEVKRGNPREAVVGYLAACRQGRYDVAAHYLDLDEIPEAEQPRWGPRLARRLKIVLDRTFWVNPAEISNDPAGAPEAGLDPLHERVGAIPLGRSKVDLLLLRRHLPSGEDAWVFAPETVAAIDALYKEHGYGWLGDRLPSFFFTVAPGEVQLWQWLALVLALFIGWGLAGLVAPRLVSALERGARRTRTAWDDALVKAVAGPARLGLLALFLVLVVPWLGLSEPGTKTAGLIWKGLALVGIAWTLARWVEVSAELLRQASVSTENTVARSFIPIFARVAKILVWALAAVVVLDSAGVHVMGLLAGLGIGGLAVAFAAQKTIENVFGSLAIAADRPFKIGDWVKIGDISGSVEDVGLRSTRIRTLARTLVTIPNGSLISERIENFGERDRFLYNPVIGLLYSSTKAQLEYVIDEIKKLLAAHPKVYDEVIRVRLAAFGPSSIDVAITCWILAADFHEYTGVAEELNFRILGIVEASGTGFAFPSQTLYLTRDTGVDAEAAKRAAAEVQARRERGELWIPEPPEGGQS